MAKTEIKAEDLLAEARDTLNKQWPALAGMRSGPSAETNEQLICGHHGRH